MCVIGFIFILLTEFCSSSALRAFRLRSIGVASCVGGVCLKIRYIHNYRTSTSKVSKSDQEIHNL
eukprot:COSAG01_NODE_2391_length_7773_cov_102.532056_1_plen_64_part_10